jgi:uncharacterized LabA/DUF88 family protein
LNLVTQPDQLRLAVFIDFDNIEIGVRNTLNGSFDAGLVLEALKERGEVVSKLAYSDWQRAGGYSRALTQHAIRMVQRNMTPGGDKNGADINLALDALEMAFTHPHINAFVIVGGDSDFISLLEKLKQYGKKVYVVGGRQFTSAIMQRNCHEFIAYENLVSSGGGGGRRAAGGRASGRTDGAASIDQVVPLVRRALEVLSERDVSPQLGLLKSTLLQLDSTFSEKSYGAGSFREFAQKLEKAGVLRVHQGKGGWLVGPPSGGGSEPAAAAADEPEPPAEAPRARGAERAASGAAQPEPARAAQARPAPPAIGQPADGVRELGLILAAATIRRWPLYLRNLKQVLKQASPEFDERAYGFANLSDLARAAHRAGIMRIERDRQGNIRMFQGVVPLASAPGDRAEDTTDHEPEAEGADGRAEAFVDAPPDAGSGFDADADTRTGAEAVRPADEGAPGDPDAEHAPDDVNGNVATPGDPAAGRGRAAKKASRPRRRPAARKAAGASGAAPRRPRARKTK